MMEGESGRQFNLGGFVCQQEEHFDNSDFSRHLFKRGKKHSKDSKRPRLPMGVVFGLTLIFLGTAFMLDNLRLIYIEDVLQFLPCALIAMGLVRLWNSGFFNIWGQILVMGGILLQIAVLRNDVVVHLWWPALVIWVGVLIVIKAITPKKSRPEKSPPGVKTIQPNEYDWPQNIDIDGVTIEHQHEDEQNEEEQR